MKYLESNVELIFNGNFNLFATTLLSSSDIPFISTNDLREYREHMLVLDDYNITQVDIDAIRQQVNTFIKIDDFNNFDLSKLDLVINFRLNAEMMTYTSPKKCLGLEYFPFKLSLRDIREKNIHTEKLELQNIFIFIGGGDETNAGKKLVRIVDETVSNKQIFLVDKNTSRQHTQQLSRNSVTYLPLISEIEKYYSNADIFITGGGLSKYEVAYCCIPNAAISQNEGQAVDTQIFAKENLTYDMGLVELLDSNPELVKSSIQEFLKKQTLERIRRNAVEKFETSSTLKLAKQLLKV
ncbi:hypothetical protein A9Q79_07980 [Methylophaga sp. 42_25_T18]|nr:hypothetical protein A9Q79_07980 [Methylophaga sp. 42_25_T18]